MKKILRAAVLAPAVAVLGLPPAAQADATPNYFHCIEAHGYVVNNIEVVLSMGRIAQNQELRNVPRDQIIRNLKTYLGASPALADTVVNCVEPLTRVGNLSN